METTSEITTTTTKEVVIGKINIALTKAELGVQLLHDAESKLTYNEDNLQSIGEFLAKSRRAVKVINDTHTAIKAPFLKECQTIDESKREMLQLVNEVIDKANGKYTTLCQDIEKKKKLAQEEFERKQRIQDGISANMISYSTRIANCKTNDELITIERLINLEKGNKNKYAEFLEQAVTKYESLTSLIKIQKENIKESEKLEAQRLEAEKANNQEQLIAIAEKQEKISAQTEELRVEVQESAVAQSLYSNSVTEAVEILPEVKTRRQTWDYEILDIGMTVKKMPSWTKVELVEEKVNEFLKANKDLWKEENREEVILHGIKFYIKKSY